MSHHEINNIIRIIKSTYPKKKIAILENSQSVTAYSVQRVCDSFFEHGADLVIVGEPYFNWDEIKNFLIEEKVNKPINVLTFKSSTECTRIIKKITPISRARADNSPGTGQDTFSSSIGAPDESAPINTSGGSDRSKPGDRTSGDGKNDWLTLTFLAAVAIFVCYADRSNISTAIIPMAKDFGWDKIQSGGVLSAFFYGYAMTQLVGGRLADSFGGKRVLALGVIGWSLATFVTPWAAAAGAVPRRGARATRRG